MVEGRGGGPTGRDAAPGDAGAGTDEAVRRAVATALRWLAVRARSEWEVRQHLRRHGVTEAMVDQVLAQLRAWGYVDDRRLALEAAEAARVRHVGPRRLRDELLRRGVPEAVVRDALEATWPAEVEREVAWELARRRWARFVAPSPGGDGRERRGVVDAAGCADGEEGAGEGPDGPVGDRPASAGPAGRPEGRGGARQRAAARLYRFLVGRGFGAEVAEAIVRRLAEEDGEPGRPASAGDGPRRPFP
ncbi:hypothetical protein E1B22_08990 [Thermaerobacter sp. FW80]|uniref:regulatory protein RecX n=1 Tax=Thermaerobacter sp. FW80 TaxID=2546351 RepID=UPI001075580C|nr:RecX family transcriptional regulator [Thermaerobacter sp. FW80]QBS37880.1 hypothetical protein E1B22_08990 [Thermaerobacter sp. FW80]